MLRIPLVTTFLERRGRRRLRHIMRGYRRLRGTNQLGKMAAVRDAFTNTRFGLGRRGVSTLIFGAGSRKAELAVCQYLLTRAADAIALNKSLLYTVGNPDSGVVHHLPPEWRKVLRVHGFRVDELRSAVAWNSFVFALFCYGVWSIGKRSLQSLRELVRPSLPALGRFAFFEGLAATHLPQRCEDGRSYDIVTWYQQWPGRVCELDSFCHSVKDVVGSAVEGVPVISVSGAIPALGRLGPLIRYVGWGIAASAVALFDLLRGRWWHPLLLRQAASAAMVRIQESDALARDYLFHNGEWIHRPLWTYEAEKKGCRVTFYFYSTNCEEFKRPEGYPIQAHSWQAMSWPRYLVWDEYQADFVRRAVGDTANISVVGPIWFQTSAKEMPGLPPDSVAVFDVQPFRASRYQVLGAPWEYFTPRTANRFLLDIYSVVRDLGGGMALKRKRRMQPHQGRLVHVEYRATIDQLRQEDEIIVVDPDLSAFRLIESCSTVISMPFTSTALLGLELGKPSIYYDPFGVVEKDDRAAHGIPVISGITELREWFADKEGHRQLRPNLGPAPSWTHS
jgi:polysaccharide biosynthesis PFTS motif protein